MKVRDVLHFVIRGDLAVLTLAFPLPFVLRVFVLMRVG